MTKLLDEAFEAVRNAPPDVQDAVAKLMFDMVDSGPGDIPPEYLAAVLEGEAQADRGAFATDKQVAAAFRRFDP